MSEESSSKPTRTDVTEEMSIKQLEFRVKMLEKMVRTTCNKHKVDMPTPKDLSNQINYFKTRFPIRPLKGSDRERNNEVYSIPTKETEEDEESEEDESEESEDNSEIEDEESEESEEIEKLLEEFTIADYEAGPSDQKFKNVSVLDIVEKLKQEHHEHVEVYPELPDPNAMVVPTGRMLTCVCTPTCTRSLFEPEYREVTEDERRIIRNEKPGGIKAPSKTKRKFKK